MGVPGAWERLEPTRVLAFRDWCREFAAEHGRPPSLAVDISNHIYQVSTEKRSQYEGVEHTQLARRLLAFLALGCRVVCVFDGPMPMDKRRHAASSRAAFLRQQSPMVAYARRLAETLRMPTIDAKGEAEAQCAAMQRQGQVDVVFTSDADVLANGATRVLRYDSVGSTGGAGSRIVKYYELDQHQAPVFAMEALLLGNDWSSGISGIGSKIASRISHTSTGFAARLVALSLSRDEEKAAAWRAELSEELKTNKHKWLTQKCNSSLPESFPDLEVVHMLIFPEVHSDVQCDPKLSNATAPPQLSDFEAVITELIQLWFQPSPFFGGNKQLLKQKKQLMNAEKSLASLQRAVAPVIIASLLVGNAPEIRAFVFKYVENGEAVEIVEAPAFRAMERMLSPDPLKGVRLRRYLIDNNADVCIQQKLAPKVSRNNSTLDSFLHLRPPPALRAESSPAPASSVADTKVTALSSYRGAQFAAPACSRSRSTARMPFTTLTGGQLNSVTSRVITARGAGRAAKRPSRSRLMADENDSRMDVYFKPRHPAPSLTSQPEPCRIVKTAKAEHSGDVTLVLGSHKLTDLTGVTPVEYEAEEGFSDTDTDTDADTDADDETFPTELRGNLCAVSARHYK